MIPPVAPRASEAAPEKLRETAQCFEAVFTQMLLRSMRATVAKSDLFHGGKGEEMFSGLLDQTLAQASALRGRGLGIAEMIVKQYARAAYGG